MKKIINSKNAPNPVGPYNQGILFDRTLYLSGQIALNPVTMKMMNKCIETETVQVFKNIKAVLKKQNIILKILLKQQFFFKI